MSTEVPPRLDRRHQRRAETIEQLLDVAVAVMGEQGVAGLSLGEVARRMGIRPPSLYVYFDSKHALYDAVFARGWRRMLLLPLPEPQADTDVVDHLRRFGEAFVRWSVENPVYTQLMMWRPVPGYQPSAEAYAPALAMMDRARAVFIRLQDLGQLRSDIDAETMLRAWTVVLSGVITQQLANAPDEPYEHGAFTELLPQLVSMYYAQYAPHPDAPPRRSGELT